MIVDYTALRLNLSCAPNNTIPSSMAAPTHLYRAPSAQPLTSDHSLHSIDPIVIQLLCNYLFSPQNTKISEEGQVLFVLFPSPSPAPNTVLTGADAQ